LADGLTDRFAGFMKAFTIKQMPPASLKRSDLGCRGMDQQRVVL
jgi:hypothetical protein